MAGPIQAAISGAITAASAAAVAGKKLSEEEKQTHLKKIKEEREAEAYKESLNKMAKEASLEADLISAGADPEKARGFITAQQLGTDTSKFGMIRSKGKFVGSYSRYAQKLAEGALADSYTAQLISDRGFAERVVALGGSRKTRVEALLEAKGGKPDGQK